MYLIVILTVGFCFLIFGAVRWKRLRDEREMKVHSIEAEDLHALMAMSQEVMLFDVRQPPGE